MITRYGWIAKVFTFATLMVTMWTTVSAQGGQEKAVGTWFCTIIEDTSFTFEALLTFTSDGNLILTTTDAFSLRDGPLLSPGFGVWTGGRGQEIAFTVVLFEFFGLRPPGSEVDGLLKQTIRARCAARTRGSNTLKVECDSDIFVSEDLDGDGFLNSPNPITADPDSVFPDAATLECTRLQVVPKD